MVITIRPIIYQLLLTVFTFSRCILAFYPTYNIDLEPSGAIEVTSSELSQVVSSSKEYQSLYFEAEGPSDGVFIDILIENIYSESKFSCPRGVVLINQNETVSRLDNRQDRVWIFIEAGDFSLILCNKAVHNNSNIIVKRFETPCYKRFSGTENETFQSWIPAWNGSFPFRCAWIIDNPDTFSVQLTYNFTFDKTSNQRPMSDETDLLVMLETDRNKMDATIYNQTSMARLVSQSRRIAIEYIALQTAGKQLQMNLKLPQKESTIDPIVSTPSSSNDCVCGRENIDERIVGGQEVNPKHRYPWMVAFLKANDEPYCGGALINSQYILTAGHCFDMNTNQTTDPRNVRIVVRAHDLTQDREYYKIRSFKIHEGYKRTGQALYNDIALVRIQGNLKLDQNIRPICLPTQEMQSFDNLTVAGWGFTSEDGVSSKVLRAVTLPYVTNRACQEFHGEVITSNMMCAGGNEEEDSCQGDSGSPLMYRKDGVVYEVGLVSFGLGCGRPSYYGVYTRVNRYLKWIHDNTAGFSFCSPPTQNAGVSTPRPSSTKTPSTEKPSRTTMSPEMSTFQPTGTQIPSTPNKTAMIPKPVPPNLQNCGMINMVNSRIFGGKITRPIEFPWMAAIGYQSKFIAGGVVVAPFFVLTSRQRIKILTHSWEFNLANLTVVLGAYDLTVSEPGKQIFQVERIYFHPSAGEAIYRPICLPRSSFDVFDGITVVGLGWGSTTREGLLPTNKLRQVKLDLITAKTCKSFYQQINTNNMLCAAKPGADMCLGDGGGPLMYPFRQRWYLLGIFSWGPAGGCAVPRKPSIFGDVRKALPWISFVTGLNTL